MMLLSGLQNLMDCKLIKDGEFDVLGLSNSPIEKTMLSFAEDVRFIDEIKHNKNIKCIICLPELLHHFEPIMQGIIISQNPRVLFFKIHNLLCSDSSYRLAEFDTQIGLNCNISQLAYIDSKNIKIGNGVTIEEFVSIRGHCEIGDNSIIHSGSQIGSSGYEFKAFDGGYFTVVHTGRTVIGRNVEIWPCSSIHKAVFPWDCTIVGDETKINSQSHIDHGAKIGKAVEICAGATISGRVQVGDFAFIGPGSVISNRIKIGDSARITMGAVVTKNVDGGETVSGNFAINHGLFLETLKKSIKK